MSIVTPPPPAAINGTANPRGRTAKGWLQDTEAKERPNRAETTPSLDELQRQRNRALEDEAKAVLRNSSYYSVRCVSCEVRQHVLTLSGCVPSFYMKQIAQTVVRHLLDGSLVLENQLEVAQT